MDATRGSTPRFIVIHGEFKWEEKFKLGTDCGSSKANTINLRLLEGGNPRPNQHKQAFENALNDYDLEDMGYIGDKFTSHRGWIQE